MKKLFYIFTTLLIFSCKKERPFNDNQINEIPEATYSKTISDTLENNKLITKYYFIGIGFTEPVSWSTTYMNGEEVKKIVRENHFYTTDIQSHDGEVNEDLKYRWLDEAERNMRNSHNSSVSTMLNEPPKTIFRELYKYDSYKDASVALQKIARGNYTENENLNTGEIKYEF
jgi:hypothetical protein